jgi:hypothetical protein
MSAVMSLYTCREAVLEWWDDAAHAQRVSLPFGLVLTTHARLCANQEAAFQLGLDVPPHMRGDFQRKPARRLRVVGD